MTRSYAFVVPAWNEERCLPATLAAIQSAAEAVAIEYEVIIADDASTDRTAELARAGGARVIACDNRQIAATRNAGAREAKADILIFVDADTHPSAATLQGVVDALDRGATYGGADVTWNTRPPFLLRVLLRATLNYYKRTKLASGAFLFCTRESFEKVGGFDEDLYAAEEYYFSRKLKHEGTYAWITSQVITSGRKLRTYSTWELLREGCTLMLRGKRGLKRSDLDLWYAERRADPLAEDGEHA